MTGCQFAKLIAQNKDRIEIVADGSRATLAPLYGALRGILVSDRATALSFWAMDRRQICWAHLLRKFVAFSERAGPSAEFGRQLLDYTGLLFDYWHDYSRGRPATAADRVDQLVCGARRAVAVGTTLRPSAGPRRGTSPSPGALRAGPGHPESATGRRVDQPTSMDPIASSAHDERERGAVP